ncbi:pentatricopeptide repeat-containing At2g20540-like [Olea europaea subsp. europaea]|uniref:Pentatricopeptide repeat-containing At2g20540-like n=1 Tax=Olea europaea subsp. europaea TaxID=158383 RepID=A0A8S0UEB7_OLEEU|nr:pentatricopeptide repeat-containing At2g20540-like [Olea europaea subsp. europaea]
MKQLEQAHAQMITCGLGTNSFGLSRILAFCSDPFHGSLSYGYKIFEQIQNPTICICNSMIKAVLLKDEYIKSIQIFKDMLRNGICPDNYTLPYVLKTCAKMKRLDLGELIHGYCLKLGLLFDNYVGNTLILMYSSFNDMEAAKCVFDESSWHCVVSWTVLISGYAKIGDVYTARLVFDKAPLKDRGIWGAMISGYVQNNCFKEGLQLFRLMQLSGIKPDEAIFVGLLCACVHMGSLEIGKWIHSYVKKLRLPLSVKLGTALIGMYVKCGQLDFADEVFDEMPNRDVVTWNAMISGYAMNGNGDCALEMFSQMQKVGVRPDDVTFISLFTACSYSNMAHEGLNLLYIMLNVYKIEPKTIAWRALLSACCRHGQIDEAEVAAKRIVQLERHSGAYILLSNVYSDAGKHDEARRIRKEMKSRGVEKTPGCSSVEINGVVHEFIAGEKTHLQMDKIYELLEIINKHFDFLQCNSSLLPLRIGGI